MPEGGQVVLQQHGEKRRDDGQAEADHVERDRARPGAAVRASQHQRPERQGRELGQSREREGHAARGGRGRDQQGDHEQERDQGVVRIRGEHEQRERIRRPRVGEHDPQRRPADPPPEHE